MSSSVPPIIEKLYPDIKYNPYKIPPNIPLCEIHYKATAFGPVNQESNECPCCWQKEKKVLPICCKQTQIAEIQPTTAYFFFVIKSIILLILSIILVYGIFTFSSTISICREDSESCVYVDFFVFKIPFLKKTDQTSVTYKILSISTLIITFVYIVLMQYYLLKRQNKYFNMVRPGDYSILISGVDHTKVSKANFIDFFLKEGIIDIQILYTHKIGKYLKAERDKAQLQTKIQYCAEKGLSYHQLLKYKEKVKIAQEILHPIINKFYFNQEVSIRTDKVFISFQNFEERQKIIEKYNTGGFQRILFELFKTQSNISINGCNMIIQQLAQPNQIIWANLEVSSLNRIVRIFIGNVITGIMLTVAFGLILLLSHFESSVGTNSDLDKFYSYMCAIGITCVNLILSYFVHFIANKQKRFTVPGIINGLMVNQTVSFFISTALMPVSMFFIYQYRPDVDSLIYNVISIFTINAFITSITVIFNLDGIYKYFMRNRIRNLQTLRTQYEANQYFEKTNFEVDFKFALIAKLGFLALFYGGAFPIGLAVSVVGLTIYYWTIKFMLVKHSQMMDTSFKIPKRMNRLLCLFPVVFTSGELINQLLINRQWTPYNFVLWIVSIGLSIFLCGYSRDIVKKLMKKYGSLVIKQKPPRSEAIRNGMIDYKHVNPTSYQELKHSDLNKKTQFSSVILNGSKEEEHPAPKQIVSLSMYVSKHPKSQ